MRNCRNINENLSSHPIEIENPNNFIDQQTAVFTLGSCFALEIKDYLINNAYNVLVSHETMSTPEPHLIWFNTFTTLYEFERITGEFTQEYDDVWNLGDRWQDPYRRCVFAPSQQELWDKIEKNNQNIRHGILGAQCLIITLGLTEVFFQRNNRAICASPGYAGGGGYDTEFRPTSFTENYNNLKKIVETLKLINPSCKLVVTVSPVPLGKTFRELDHLVANTESKSILRAVAGQIARENAETVNYFHSYELASFYDRNTVYIEDARHVKREFVSNIMVEFKKYFMK